MRNSLFHLLRVCAVLTLTAGAADAQTFTVLYNFGSSSADPSNPQYSGVIVQGRDGNLYTTSPFGGIGDGTVFKITPGGSLSVLFESSLTPGFEPYGGLILGTDGNFYGTNTAGGTSYDAGTIFKITPSGTLTDLYDFTGASDGSLPYAPPIQGTDGNFYGTTSFNGSNNNYGTIYKVTPPGQLKTLYDFDYTHGANPYGPLIQGTDGNFYGTTERGGSNGGGTVYRITSSGKLTVLFNFDGSGGYAPFSGLVQGADGNFYGTTAVGGGLDFGSVFKMTPSGEVSFLHNFNGGSDGCFAYSGLVQATDDNLYGVASGCGSLGYGTVYQVNPAGAFSVLYNFDGTTGRAPSATLIQHTNGILYGDTSEGGMGTGCGSTGCGTFYSLNLGLAPFVRLVSPLGKVGKTVEVLGQGLTGTNNVSFNGTSAKFKVLSDTYLTTTVPSGATTGAVTVSTPGGTLTSNQNFRVIPSITGFSPGSGPVGTPVILTGLSLLQTTKVTFGGVAATTFTVNSDSQATAIVPSGARTGRIAITTLGGSAVSASVFTVAP